MDINVDYITGWKMYWIRSDYLTLHRTTNNHSQNNLLLIISLNFRAKENDIHNIFRDSSV